MLAKNKNNRLSQVVLVWSLPVLSCVPSRLPCGNVILPCHFCSWYKSHISVCPSDRVICLKSSNSAHKFVIYSSDVVYEYRFRWCCGHIQVDGSDPSKGVILLTKDDDDWIGWVVNINRCFGRYVLLPIRMRQWPVLIKGNVLFITGKVGGVIRTKLVFRKTIVDIKTLSK